MSTAEQTIFRGVDHNNRGWLVTIRSGTTGFQVRPATLVTFVCRTQKGRKVLDQTAAWMGTGWDMTRWFPSSPRPVPVKILQVVQNSLLELQP